mmetsp:Transcript_13309/g.27042  ORF Transcript_13309/g.27042 Transcript_13309/m.27042 type:complete len:232 (+) Transcript_13309:2744-3439(+)
MSSEKESGRVRTSPTVRVRKLRKRAHEGPMIHRGDEERPADGDDDDNDDVVGVREKVELLREAQRIKQRSRRSLGLVEQALAGPGYVQGQNGVGTSDDDFEANDDAKVVEGLRENFRIESANREIEAQMEKYIEERLASRADSGIECSSKIADSQELYQVPAHLIVPPRPMYDPGEGLPVSGIEEVELPASVRYNNAVATQQAVASRGGRRGVAKATDHLVAQRFKNKVLK